MIVWKIVSYWDKIFFSASLKIKTVLVRRVQQLYTLFQLLFLYIYIYSGYSGECRNKLGWSYSKVPVSIRGSWGGLCLWHVSAMETLLSKCPSAELKILKHLKLIRGRGGIAAGWMSQCQTTTPDLRVQNKRLSLIQRQLIMDEGRHHWKLFTVWGGRHMNRWPFPLAQWQSRVTLQNCWQQKIFL